MKEAGGDSDLYKGRAEERRSSVEWRGSKEQMNGPLYDGHLMGEVPLCDQKKYLCNASAPLWTEASLSVADLLGPKVGPEHATG